MVVRLLLCVCLAAMAAWCADPAAAERRVALVIGNGAYSKAPRLDNPTNDSKAIEALLKAAGFDKVVRTDNLGGAQMRRALRDFSDEVRDADIAVVFYAGHGMEMNGVNYLIPVDAVLERDADIVDEAISLDRVHQALEQAKRLRLVILDACRDNPFVRSMRRTLAGRSIGRGLAPVEVAATDTLIAYAAKAGSTAADGDGANSPYTAAVLKHLATPGLDVRLALGRVRDEVLRTTSRRQEPFVYGSLGGAEVPLFAAPRTSIASGGATTSAAAEAWDRIKDTSDTSVLEAFISRFGDTFFSDLARSRLAALRKEQQHLALLLKQEEDRKRSEAATAETQAQDLKLTYFTGPTGGSWVPIAGALKSIWEKANKRLSIVNRPGAALINLAAIEEGKADIGMGNMISTVDALKGIGPGITKPYVNICHLASIYPQVQQVAARADQGINTLSDLKDKSLGTLPRGNLTELVASWIMDASGIGYKGLSSVNFASIADQANMFKDGRISVSMIISTLPTGAIMDMANSRPVRMLDIPDNVYNELVRKNAGFTRFAIPKGTYPGLDKDVQSVQFSAHVVVSCKLPDDVVYNMAKSMTEALPELASVNSVFKRQTVKEFGAKVAMKVHPGAEKYFKEKGAM